MVVVVGEVETREERGGEQRTRTPFRGSGLRRKRRTTGGREQEDRTEDSNRLFGRNWR